MAISGLLAALLPTLSEVLERLIPDADAREKARGELARELLNREGDLVKAQADIIKTEAAGEGLKSQWRPALMLVIVVIVANNYILAPYLHVMFGAEIFLQLPDRLWDLMSIGVGGYVVGRSGEKIVSTLRR